MNRECFCHKIDPTQSPCQVCSRIPTAPDAEPVAWMYRLGGNNHFFSNRQQDRINGIPLDNWTETPLYTTPRVDAETVERMKAVFKRHHRDSCYPEASDSEADIFARALIAALKQGDGA